MTCILLLVLFLFCIDISHVLSKLPCYNELASAVDSNGYSDLYICGGSYRVQRTCISAVDPKDYSALVTIKFSEALPLPTHAHTVTVLIATVPGQKYR